METIHATAPPLRTVSKTISHRLNAIDLLRGLVMIIMALDHTRDFFHISAFTSDPLNLQITSPQLFFTRWITHFCAPVFVFLSGMSVYLQSLRKNRKELSSFLIKRGLWLILVELTLVSFGITFDVSFSLIALQVIWSIGISMVLLGLLIYLPFSVLLTLGLIIVLGHNALDYYERNNPPPYSIFYHLLHRPVFYPLGGGYTLGILYPFLAWTGVMILGFCFARLYSSYEDRKQRARVSMATGAGLILFFICLRFMNGYGDPLPWSEQPREGFTILSFINTQKYPPSLLYLCMTIGPALLFMGIFGRAENRLSRIITVYGRVPFFYYILHFYLIHVVSAIATLLRGHSWSEAANGVPGFPFKFVFPGEGYSLEVVYLVWIAIVVSLYPLCKWFSEYKRKHSQWWLSYI